MIGWGDGHRERMFRLLGYFIFLFALSWSMGRGFWELAFGLCRVTTVLDMVLIVFLVFMFSIHYRSEERRVGKECPV